MTSLPMPTAPRRLLPLVATAVLLFAPGFRQNALRAQGPTDPLTLAEAIAWGVDNDLAAAGQRLAVEVAARNDNWVTAGRRPLVQATLDVAPSFNSQDNPASFINGTFFNGAATAGLQASYTLFNGYRVRFARRQLGQQVELADAQLRQLLETSVFGVTEAYYTAQLRQAEEALARELLALSRDRVAYQRTRRAYGQGSSLELLQARTSALQDSAAVERAELATANARRALYLALDAPADAFAGRALGDTLTYTPGSLDPDAVASRLDSAASLRLLRTQERLALTQTELARAALQPTVNVTAGLTHTRTALRFLGEVGEMGPPDEFIFGTQGSGRVGVTAAYTLFDAGQRRRDVANAVTQERVARLAVDDARRGAEWTAGSLLASRAAQLELLGVQDALLATARANLAVADEQLRAGAINSFDVRALQLAYLQAAQARLGLVYNLLVTELQLRRLTGGLVG